MRERERERGRERERERKRDRERVYLTDAKNLHERLTQFNL